MNPKRQLSRLSINLSYLEQNILELKKLQPMKEILFMVKADAYGHGLLSIVEYANKKADIRSFGVASFQEALSIREALPELKCDLYVFSEVALDIENNIDVYVNYRIFPVISSLADLNIFLNRAEFKNFPLCLKFDTGMNRLGISYKDVNEVSVNIKAKGRSEVFHLMSHFANASMPIDKNKRNLAQRENFENIKNQLKKEGISFSHSSLANSGALEQGIESDDDFIRPGLMLFGPSSLSPKHKALSIWKGKNISRLETTVLKVFSVKKGDPLSYGSTPCPDDGVIVILPLGYGDGISTSYQGAKINMAGITGHICARVCMDLMTVLLKSDSKVKVGDEISVWDHNQSSLNDLSEQTKTIPYELVIRITPRVPRFYITSDI